MAHRFVFSQMFDVRPRTPAGDLDVEKIKKIEAILNLQLGIPAGQGWKLEERIAELVQEEENLAEGQGNIKKRRERRPKQQVTKKRYNVWPSFSPVDLKDELFEVSTPDEKEILSVFEMIEAVEQSLKNRDKEEAFVEEFSGPKDAVAAEIIAENSGDIAYRIPIKNISVLPEEVVKEVIEESEVPIISEAEPESFFAADEAENESQSETAIDIPWQPEFLVQKEAELLPVDYSSEKIEKIGKSFWLKPRRGEEERMKENYLSVPEFSSIAQKIRPRSVFGERRRPLVVFLAISLAVFSLVPLFNWIGGAFSAKNVALDSGTKAYESLIAAKDSLAAADFAAAQNYFALARDNFATADSEIDSVGGWLVDILEKVPGLSYFSSRTRLVRVGQEMSQAGEDFSEMVNIFEKNDLSPLAGASAAPLTETLAQAREYLVSGTKSLIQAKQDLERIKISSLPQEFQPQMALLADKLPQIAQAASGAIDWSDKFLQILGQENAKKYLFIFQNNAEMRPTGGFIGTYGVLDLDQGQVKNLFIDGIFNADGQLREKIIPPRPIQKISTAWSMHDANWFADFPSSARKVMWFFEKTGGPTTDGVISLTPTVIERLLGAIGPIDMPEYGVTLGAQNFFEVTEYKVEVDYDKELNQPKKILADFAPKFIERLNEELRKNNLEILKIISQALSEKHILVYFNDAELEEFARIQGWSGEIKSADKDFLAVVNTNINGFKTDRVVKEDIRYSSQIQEDGSIIDTVVITRHHQGGGSNYEWFNKVNADYLRVYVPKGSQLLSAQGQTRETYSPPIDYQTSGFKADQDLAIQAASLKKDEASGTDIFEESGKTVFGNWVYVSPGETATLIYQYRLPFRIGIPGGNANFSLLAQKQAGSIASGLDIKISWPKSLKTIWSSIPLSSGATEADLKTDLRLDRAVGFAFFAE